MKNKFAFETEVLCVYKYTYSTVFEVITAVTTKITIFWNITPCSPVKVNRRFGVKPLIHAGLLLRL
jgi:hypothetical protein